MPIPNNRYSAKHGKQTGTPSKTTYGGKQRRKTTVDPWGPIIPNRLIGKVNGIGQSIRGRLNLTRGSATRKPVPDASLKGMKYPANNPTQWPIQNPPGTYTKQQDPYGITPTVITNVNAAINHAYKRAGYPEP
jgi:hypothetical protein